MRKAKSNPGRKLAALVLSCAAVISAAVAADTAPESAPAVTA